MRLIYFGHGSINNSLLTNDAIAELFVLPTKGHSICSLEGMKQEFGGESGIRTLSESLNSVSYRFHNPGIATDASLAVADEQSPLNQLPRELSRNEAVTGIEPSAVGDRALIAPTRLFAL
ncbi:MAG TPA: hypothetical protein VF456_26610 [Vicinamibacterales bacterium]